MARSIPGLHLVGILALGVISAVLPSTTATRAADSPGATSAPFVYHQTDVLGTSCDITVIAPAMADADLASKTVLDEIERLRKILSTYDAASDLARINASTDPVKVAPEVIDVLTAYDTWHKNTGGAHNGQLGALIALWKQAEKTNTLPANTDLAPIVRQLAQPAWQIDPAAGTVKRLTTSTLNVDSIGKAYIIGKAVAAARAKAPSVTGLLLDIGGDMYAFGASAVDKNTPWDIAIADPHHPADNAAPLDNIRVQNMAVGTSGNYARFYTINGKKYSHIFDPRTGQPADIEGASAVIQSTVIAKDNVTANALATSLCVLNPTEGLNLVRATPGVSALLVTGDGRVLKSEGFAAYEYQAPKPTPVMLLASATPVATAPAPANAWPNNFNLSTDITILPGRNAKARPFIYLWVTDADGKYVRTIAAWGSETKYIREMTAWWKVAPHDPQTIKTVTRATRAAGKYTFTWDGTDDKGAPVPTGTYTITLEVNFEKGPHSTNSVAIDCKAAAATAKLPATPGFNEANLTYGPAK